MGCDMYGVWCEVWGGVTGSRASWMKNNGERVEFATLKEAQDVAQKLTETIALNPHHTANFRYTAKKIDHRS